MPLSYKISREEEEVGSQGGLKKAPAPSLRTREFSDEKKTHGGGRWKELPWQRKRPETEGENRSRDSVHSYPWVRHLFRANCARVLRSYRSLTAFTSPTSPLFCFNGFCPLRVNRIVSLRWDYPRGITFEIVSRDSVKSVVRRLSRRLFRCRVCQWWLRAAHCQVSPITSRERR